MSGSYKFDMSKLQIFVKSLDDKHNVQVGIFASKSSRKDGKAVTNADIGAIHEFGSFSRRIPARSFLRMPIAMKSKDILDETSQGAKELMEKGKIVMVLKRLGIACENAIQQAFSSRGFGSWKPDATSTVKRKHHSDAPLIDTSQLRRSITSRVVAI